MEISISYSGDLDVLDDLSGELIRVYFEKLKDYFNSLSIPKKQKVRLINEIIKMYR